ncbi:hypothetical protein DQ195_03380 [Enterococcus faecium]|nr:hypothetical protein [Enterococcus faecium]EGP5732394.1 hypothetical protein [Enterococcus faecium]
MDFYSNFILIIAILLLLNIWFFDKSRNAGIGFRTKRSTSSEKKVGIFTDYFLRRGYFNQFTFFNTLFF